MRLDPSLDVGDRSRVGCHKIVGVTSESRGAAAGTTWQVTWIKGLATTLILVPPGHGKRRRRTPLTCTIMHCDRLVFLCIVTLGSSDDDVELTQGSPFRL